MGGGTPAPKGVRPMASHCLPDDKCSFKGIYNRLSPPPPALQPPPTACLTASGAASEVPSPRMQPWWAVYPCTHGLSRGRGLQFLPSPTTSPQVYECRQESSNGDELIAIFLHDNFARPNKQGGAWMSAYRTQARHTDGTRIVPVVVNNNNFSKAAPGEQALLSFDDATTLFHEFGHGLHGMLSDVAYHRLAGTNVLQVWALGLGCIGRGGGAPVPGEGRGGGGLVCSSCAIGRQLSGTRSRQPPRPQDFVELPSQLYEHWLAEEEVLKRHARHVDTGVPIPDELIARMKAAQTFNQGFDTVEYTVSALLDQVRLVAS